MKQIHYLNGKIVNPPGNHEEISLQINFDNDNEDRQINVSSFEWLEAEAATLLSIFQGGLTGGTGVFEGVPHKLSVEENGQSLEFFDGYVNLRDALYDRDKITADSIARANIDWLNDIGDSFSFEYLAHKGIIDSDDYIFVPYCLGSVPNYNDTMIVILTMFFIITELKSIIADITKSLGEIATVIDTAGGIIGLVTKIVYAIAMIATMVTLILDLVSLIIGLVKYKPAMMVNKLMEKGCEYLGLTYSSPVLQSATWSKLCVIPESYNNPADQSDNRLKGFFKPDRKRQTGYYRGSFSDLIRELTTAFNLRVKISNGELSLVEKKISTAARFRLQNYYNPVFRTNANDIISNYVLSFQTDTTDKQTIQNWQGTNVQVSLEPISVTNKDLRLTKGLDSKLIGFARAKTKTELEVPEEVADTLLDVIGGTLGVLINVANAAIVPVNAAIRTLNKVKKALAVVGVKIKVAFQELGKLTDPELGELIDGRLSMMLIETDIIGEPKLALVNTYADEKATRLAVENATHLNAKYLYENFHANNSFAPSTETAQRYILEYEDVEMSLIDVKNVIEDRAVRLPSGETAEVSSCDWNPSTRKAKFVLRKKQIYTNNLKEVIIEPQGH